MIGLEGSQVILDIIRPLDFDRLLDWRNNHKIFKWCRQHDLLTFNEHNRWTDRLGKDKSIRMYALRLLDPEADIVDYSYNELIGVCGLTDIDLVNQRAEFSLYIGPEYHGHKYGTQALRTLCHWSFLHLPLNIIYGETFAKNKALDIFTSLGFKKEGIRRDFYYRDVKFINATLFSLKRGELKYD